MATVLVGTWEDGLFAVSADGCMREFAGQAVRGLAPDGRGGALAVVGGRSVWRRGAGGEWTRVAESEVELACCLAVQGTVFVGTEDARVLRLNGAGVLEELEGFGRVAGRDGWYAGSALVNGVRMGPPLGIRSMAASADGGVLYANVHVGGIPRSIDGGMTWQPTIAIDCDVHQVCAHPVDPRVVIAAAAVGLWVSRDAGATWTVETEGLDSVYCSAVAFVGAEIWVSAAADHFAERGRVYRRGIAGGPLFAVGGGLPEWMDGIVDTDCVAVKGAGVAVVDRGGNLYGSEDGGRSWVCLMTGLPAPSAVLLC